MQPLITCLNFQVNYFMGKCLKSSRLRCQNNSDLSHLLYSNQQKSEQHRNQEKGFHTINQKEIKKLQQDTSQFSSTLSIPSFFLKGSSISPVSIFKERTCSFWTVYLFLRAIISKKTKGKNNNLLHSLLNISDLQSKQFNQSNVFGQSLRIMYLRGMG